MKRLSLVTIAALVTGCVTANVTRLVQTVYPPNAPEEVTVLADISELMADTIRYERLAIINLSGDGGGFTDQTDMLNKAREEAAKLGANAILLRGYTQGDYNALWGTQSDNEGSAIAIRYWIVKDATFVLRKRP